MATLKPFRAFRPAVDKAQLIVTRSYVSYPRKVLNMRLGSNPFSFIHIIMPEFGMKEKTKPNTVSRFAQTRTKFQEFVEKGYFKRDEKPGFYVYRQQKNGRTYTGIIGCVSVDDYISRHIKVHEDTLINREKVFMNYLDTCKFNAEPVLLTYPNEKWVDFAVEGITSKQPEYCFTTTDHVLHELWPVYNSKSIAALQASFSNISTLYIADGHHRCASSVLLAKKRRVENPDYTGQENFNFFMAYLLPESQLNIMDYNRIVRDLNGYSEAEFLEKLSTAFVVSEVAEVTETAPRPTQLHEYTMYLKGTWFRLKLRQELIDNHAASPLDSQVLTDFVLTPILDIKNLRTNRRIKFVNGIQGMAGLMTPVDKGKAAVAFALYPVSIKQLKSIADTNFRMPPKSTWIEPKLRSGMTILNLE